MSTNARQVLPAEFSKLTIVVPAFNEERNLARVVSEIKALSVNRTMVDWVVVDDGSRDQTRRVAQALGSKVVSLAFNMGIGVSVQTGFKYALERKADYVIQVDADGQHIPSEIEKLFSEIRSSNADVVVGSRFQKSAAAGLQTTTVPRWLGGRLLGWTVFLLTGARLSDPTSGFRIFNRKAAEFIANHYPDDYPEVEVLVTLMQNGFIVKETPVQMRSRAHGHSSINWVHSIYYVWKVTFASFMHRIRR